MNITKYLFTLLLSSSIISGAFAQVKKGHATWSSQSNIYEVNLRQYSASGSFRDFAKHLPRLKKMGVEILWFMPVTPIGIKERKLTPSDLGSYYAVRNYTDVSEEYGTMADWKWLVKKAQGMGFRVITDWVANHSSPDNHWVSTHPDFYAKDSTGKIISPFDWTDTYKLDYNNKEMRDSMVAAMKFWLQQTGIDGFRCDVAGEVPRDFWKDCITSLKKIKDVYMLAEGEEPWLHEAGFDQTYTWSVMGTLGDVYSGKKNIKHLDTLLNENIAKFPKDAYRLYFTTNHDENSWNGTEFEKYGDAHKAFAVLSQTMFQSVPLIYNGQEEPNKKRLKFFVKDTIAWKNYSYADFYRTLLKARRSNPALAANAAYQRLNTSNDEAIFSFIRKKSGKKVAVFLNLSGTPQDFTITSNDALGKGTNLFTKKKVTMTKSSIQTIAPWGYAVYDYSK